MSTPKYLTEILSPAKSEIDIIRDFAVSTNEALQNKKPEVPPDQQDPTHAEDLRQFWSQLTEALQSGNLTKTKIGVSGSAGTFVMQMVYPIKQRQFLAEMTLSFLASHLEAFLKDYVLAILVRNPSLLKSSSMITYQDACDFSTIQALRRELAERHIEALGRGSIDDSSQYFEKKFSVSFSAFDRWPTLRECIYRRNLIVHNRGQVNQTYRTKTGYTGADKKLTTDMEYINEAAEVISDFMQYIHDRVGSKFSPRHQNKIPNSSSKSTPLRGAD